jgi:hypothetical protein
LSEPALFINTSFIYALINPQDQWHKAAVKLNQKLVIKRAPLVTAEFVLTQIANGLSAIKFRQAAGKVIRILLEDELVTVIPAATSLFTRGFDLYENRDDKSWGLTDCISFVVMKEHDLSVALTTDDHFRQAGFRALLLEDV